MKTPLVLGSNLFFSEPISFFIGLNQVIAPRLGSQKGRAVFALAAKTVLSVD